MMCKLRMRARLETASRVALLCLMTLAAMPTLAQNVPCPFDETSLSFKGSPVEQARCLLRPVRMYGRLGPPLKKLPEPLENLIGRPVRLERERLREFLAARGIRARPLLARAAG